MSSIRPVVHLFGNSNDMYEWLCPAWLNRTNCTLWKWQNHAVMANGLKPQFWACIKRKRVRMRWKAMLWYLIEKISLILHIKLHHEDPNPGPLFVWAHNPNDIDEVRATLSTPLTDEDKWNDESKWLQTSKSETISTAPCMLNRKGHLINFCTVRQDKGLMWNLACLRSHIIAKRSRRL